MLALGSQGLVTPRRVLFAWRLPWPPHAEEWTHDQVTFDELTGWSEGRTHDQRPILRVEHPPHRRLEWVPAHRLLWFRWGNSTGVVEARTTDFRFGAGRAPVYLALLGRLQSSDIPVGELFYESVPGTRAERLRGSIATLDS